MFSQDLTIISTDSSNLSLASFISILKPLNSLYLYPFPTPNWIRPLDNKSIVATCSANKTGLCHGKVRTAVPSLILEVLAAR